jgi:uncharacterized protein YbaP (TraB family)
MRRLVGGLAILLLAACAPEPQPAKPALWRVEGAHGEWGYLFGTIHSLKRPALWRSGKVGPALDGADRIVVEVARLSDQASLSKTFAAISKTPDLPPLSERVDPALRPRLAEAMSAAGARENDFADVETWAVALSLARAGQSADDAANGIDRAVEAAASGRPVVELEGAASQLGLFDALPEKEQRDLLAAVLRDGNAIDSESGSLAEAWRKGDMALIAGETRKGLLADPELREALYTVRNRAWTEILSAMLAKRQHPFVAVGAAHMAGPEGLPALLATKGYKVTRVQ